MLAAWLRLPAGGVLAALAGARRASLLPAPRCSLGAGDAAAGLIAVMAASMDEEAALPARIARACSMSLEAPDGADPLDAMPRGPFGLLVGQTAGAASVNGYLNFAETLGAALARHEPNAGLIGLERLTLRLHGTAAAGTIQARTPDGTCAWNFTPDGRPVQRAGLCREVSAGPAILTGIGFLLSAEAARG